MIIMTMQPRCWAGGLNKKNFWKKEIIFCLHSSLLLSSQDWTRNWPFPLCKVLTPIKKKIFFPCNISCYPFCWRVTNLLSCLRAKYLQTVTVSNWDLLFSFESFLSLISLWDIGILKLRDGWKCVQFWLEPLKDNGRKDLSGFQIIGADLYANLYNSHLEVSDTVRCYRSENFSLK